MTDTNFHSVIKLSLHEHVNSSSSSSFWCHVVLLVHNAITITNSYIYVEVLATNSFHTKCAFVDNSILWQQELLGLPIKHIDWVAFRHEIEILPNFVFLYIFVKNFMHNTIEMILSLSEKLQLTLTCTGYLL